MKITRGEGEGEFTISLKYGELYDLFWAMRDKMVEQASRGMPPNPKKLAFMQDLSARIGFPKFYDDMLVELKIPKNE